MDTAKEYPLYYPPSPASLKQFASTRVALDLWHHRGFNLTNSTVTCPEEEFSCEKTLQTKLPSSIRELIDERIRSIRKELEYLFDHFNQLNILTNLNENAFECLDCISYGPDSTLSAEATARKLLSSDKLSIPEKYTIACIYRLDKDIRKFWPSVFDQLFGNFQGTREQQRMCYSSTGPLPKDSDVLDMSFLNFRSNEPPPLFLYFYTLIDCGNWSGMEYFLNCIGGTEEQCKVLGDALELWRFEKIKYVLAKLNKKQANYFLEKYPDRIIPALAIEECCFEYVSKIWSLVKGSMTEINFCLLLSKLVSISYFDRNLHDSDQVSRTKIVLYEIYISAPGRLKNAFLFHKAPAFFESLKTIILEDETIKTKDFDLNVKFFSKLLTDMPIELRTTIWLRFWIVFLIFFNLEYFVKFMGIGLGNYNVEKFVKIHMFDYNTSKTYVEYIFNKQFYGDLIKYVDFCSTFCDDRLIREFKKQLRLNLAMQPTFAKFDKLIELGEFVTGISTNVHEANEIKKNIFFSDDVQRLLVSKIKEGLFEEVISVTGHFVDPLRSLRERQMFLDHWHNFLTMEQANNDDVRLRWNEFLSWWGGNGEGLWIFKQFLPVDEIFEKLFLEVVPKLELWLGRKEMERREAVPSSMGGFEAFAEIDTFLMWYFGTEVEARNYKWGRILSYQNVPALKDLLSVNNECIINDALRWFFNGDLIEVGNFKDSYL